MRRVLPDVVTGIGGVHAHFMYEEVLNLDGDAVDYVFRGEGEVTLPRICCRAWRPARPQGRLPASRSCARGESCRPPSRPFLHSLDALPTAWDLVDWDLYRFYPLPDTNWPSSPRREAATRRARSAASRRSGVARGARGPPRTSSTSCRCSQGAVRRRRDHVLRRDPDAGRRRAGRPYSICSSSATSDSTCSWRRASTTSCATRTSCGATGKRAFEHIYVGVERTDQASLDLQEEHRGGDGRRAIELINSTT